MDEVKLVLTLNELKYIGSVLEGRPYKESAGIIAKLQKQVDEQINVNEVSD